MKRIAVVGATGSGKTTLAIDIAHRLDLQNVETDSIYWGPHWQPISLDNFRFRMDAVTSGDRWVIDGNYSKVRDLVWGRADTLVWLDYSLLLVCWRLLKRSIPRVFKHTELWNGNRETVRGMFFSRDSLFVWLFQSYNHQRRSYPVLFKEPMYKHLACIRLKSPRETYKWLEILPTSESTKT